MNATDGAGNRARWEVLWISAGRVQRKDCGDDLFEALRIRDLAIAGERRAVTLRCCNVGFPPPVKYRERTIVFERPKRRPNGEVVRSVHIEPMKKLNAQGVWWCPYCLQLRKFVKRSGFYVPPRNGDEADIWVAEPGLHCPMCNVSHRDHHVRKYNPTAGMLEYRAVNQRIPDPNRKAKRAAARKRRRQEQETE